MEEITKPVETPFNIDQYKLLEQEIDPQNVSQREVGFGERRMTLNYIESFYAIETANRIFGFDGWSTAVVQLVVVHDGIHEGKNGNAFEIGMQATVQVRAGSVERQDVGYGTGIDYNSKAAAYESAGKEAVSDALKRTLRTFGPQFGNSLYDRQVRQKLGLEGGSPRKNSVPAPVTGTKNKREGASEHQIKFIKKLLGTKNKDLADFTKTPLEKLSSGEASRIITLLQGQ